MTDTGWVTVGSAANNADAGDVAWTNTANILVADDVDRASSTITKSGTSQYLHATNFGFSLPSGSTIDGIEALVRRAGNSSYISEHTIQIIKGGSRSGANKAGATWTSTTPTTSTYGGASDLWSNSLTRSDVIASNFGLAIRASNSGSSALQARVYYAQMKVHYTEPAGNTGAFFALFSVKDRIREILRPRRRFWMPEPVFA